MVSIFVATHNTLAWMLTFKGGAPLAHDVAQALQDKAHFINCLGVTEVSNVWSGRPDPR